MANIRLGEVVEVLVSGYHAPVGTTGIVSGMNSVGFTVDTYEFGEISLQYNIPAFALRVYPMPSLDRVWWRLQSKEDMLLKAMEIWGVGGISITPTHVSGELFRVSMTRYNKAAFSVRANSIKDVLKMCFRIAYFTRLRMDAIYKEQQELLHEVGILREVIREL